MEELKEIWKNIQSILEFNLVEIGKHSISIYDIVIVVFILLIIRLLVKLLERFVERQIKGKKWITEGKQHAII